MHDRKAEAMETLAALGCTVARGGDVRELRAKINRIDERRAHRPKVFSAESQCKSKRYFKAPEAASRAAKMIGNPDVRPYRCAYCGGWHNGNPPRG